MTISALLYLIFAVLGFSVVLPAEDIALIEQAGFVTEADLPVGVCGLTKTEHYPDGSKPNNDTVVVSVPSSSCTVEFLPTAIIHEVGHVHCNQYYAEWQKASTQAERQQRSEECAWWYVWVHQPSQTVRIFLPPNYIPVIPTP